MAGRGGFTSMPYGQPRSSNMFGTAPTLQAGPSAAAQSGHDPRGRSFGGGTSSFNPFAHDGQGQYHNPYEINPVANPAPVAPSTSAGGFHSIGGSNKRRGQGPLAGAQAYEVPRLSPSPSSNFAEPTQHYGGHTYAPPMASFPPQQVMQPQPSYHQPQWQQQQPQQATNYAPPPLWNKFEANNSYQNNNYEPQQYEARPSSSDKYQQQSSFQQRPPSSRSTLGSAGAMAMMSAQDEPGYGYTDNNQRQQQQPPSSYGAPPASHRPDIYHHNPTNVAPSPAKPAAQWSGTGSFGHSSTRVSRPPGGHSQFVLG